MSPKSPRGLVAGKLSKEHKEKTRALFELAAKWVKDHHREGNVPQSVLFRLYGLYKRSTAGACNVRQPTLFVEPVARERFNAWKSVTHLSEDIAMREYIELVRLNFATFATTFESDYKALDDIDVLRRENRHLLMETSDLLQSLRTVQQTTISKRGHLYRFRTEQIGFSTSKWVRQYVVLQGTTLSLYDRPDAAAPTRTITLQQAIVRIEGPKKGDQYWVFDLIPEEEGLAGQGGAKVHQLHNLEDGGVIVRLSTTSETDMDEWVDALQQACVLGYVEAMKEAKGGQQVGDFSGEGEVEKAMRLRREVSMHFAMKRKLSEGAIKLGGDGAGTAPVATRPIIHTPSTYLPHRHARPSVLAVESPPSSYQGLANLAMCCLAVIFANQILDLVKATLTLLRRIIVSGARVQLPTLAAASDFPFLCGGLEVIGFAAMTWAIELLASTRVMLPYSSSLIPLLHVVTLAASLVRPCVGATLLFFAVVTFLKLVSYVHTNHELREDYKRKTRKERELHRAEKKGPQYPQNLTASDMAYFFLAPTLCYQIDFPRSPVIRKRVVLSLLARIAIVTPFGSFLITNQIQPMAFMAVEAARDSDYLGVVSILFKMAIPSTFVWLIMFFVYFECWLNLMAELLRFGDRLFYKDWWNATTFGVYWRTWNMPVHQWMVRHLFFPLLRMGFQKTHINVLIFTFSAVFHEILISIPCHMVRCYALFAMLGQIPLVVITEELDKRGYLQNSQLGNYAFWMIFCVVGQPAAVLLYTFDYMAAHGTPPAAVAAAAASTTL